MAATHTHTYNLCRASLLAREQVCKFLEVVRCNSLGRWPQEKFRVRKQEVIFPTIELEMY